MLSKTGLLSSPIIFSSLIIKIQLFNKGLNRDVHIYAADMSRQCLRHQQPVSQREMWWSQGWILYGAESVTSGRQDNGCCVSLQSCSLHPDSLWSGEVTPFHMRLAPFNRDVTKNLPDRHCIFLGILFPSCDVIWDRVTWLPNPHPIDNWAWGQHSLSGQSHTKKHTEVCTRTHKWGPLC